MERTSPLSLSALVWFSFKLGGSRLRVFCFVFCLKAEIWDHKCLLCGITATLFQICGEQNIVLPGLGNNFIILMFSVLNSCCVIGVRILKEFYLGAGWFWFCFSFSWFAKSNCFFFEIRRLWELSLCYISHLIAMMELSGSALTEHRK